MQLWASAYVNIFYEGDDIGAILDAVGEIDDERATKFLIGMLNNSDRSKANAAERSLIRAVQKKKDLDFILTAVNDLGTRTIRQQEYLNEILKKCSIYVKKGKKGARMREKIIIREKINSLISLCVYKHMAIADALRYVFNEWEPSKLERAFKKVFPSKPIQDEAEGAEIIIKMLVKLRYEGCIELLPPILLNDNEEWNVRASAAWALGQLVDKKAIEPLIQILVGLKQDFPDFFSKKFLYDSKHYSSIRQEAASALGKIGGRTAIEALSTVVDDADGMVAAAARQALERVKK